MCPSNMFDGEFRRSNLTILTPIKLPFNISWVHQTCFDGELRRSNLTILTPIKLPFNISWVHQTCLTVSLDDQI